MWTFTWVWSIPGKSESIHTSTHTCPRTKVQGFSVYWGRPALRYLKDWWWYAGNENKLWSLLESLRLWCLPQNSHERLEVITEHPSQLEHLSWTLKELWLLQEDCGFPNYHNFSLKRRRGRTKTLRKRSPLGTNQAEGISCLAFSTNRRRMSSCAVKSL